jgi:DNA-directed RNA polymerase I subunit RPA2
LIEASDKAIFEAIVCNDLENTFVIDRVELMLRKFKNYSLYTRDQCLSYLGDKFRVVMGMAEDASNIDVGKQLLYKVVLVHLKSNEDKFRLLAFMVRKLYALVSGECAPDNPDSPQHQEVLLGGFLYAGIIKEKLEDWLNLCRAELMRDARRNPSTCDFFDRRYLTRVMWRVPHDIGQKLHYFLATGNLVSTSGLDLQQTSGFTIVAEKLNFLRYLSHFRCIHRGSFFAELKTTTVRKLLPEAWGFLCPVHTPDGAPCGLLNHLSHTCKVVTHFAPVDHLPRLLARLGVSLNIVNPGAGNVTVQLDGRIVGWCTPSLAERVARELRHWKVTGQHAIPIDLEIGYVPPSNRGQYPGLYLFSTPSRMMRPVRYLATDQLDMVGTFEQVSTTLYHSIYYSTTTLGIYGNCLYE